MASTKDYGHVVSFRADDELYAALMKIADAEDRTIAKVVKRLLKIALNGKKR